MCDLIAGGYGSENLPFDHLWCQWHTVSDARLQNHSIFVPQSESRKPNCGAIGILTGIGIRMESGNYFLRLGIQHPFKLHITLLTKLIVDVVSCRFHGPSPVLWGSTNKASAVTRPPQGGWQRPCRPQKEGHFPNRSETCGVCLSTNAGNSPTRSGSSTVSAKSMC